MDLERIGTFMETDPDPIDLLFAQYREARAQNGAVVSLFIVHFNRGTGALDADL